jgi:hypothetical protein
MLRPFAYLRTIHSRGQSSPLGANTQSANTQMGRHVGSNFDNKMGRSAICTIISQTPLVTMHITHAWKCQYVFGFKYEDFVLQRGLFK